MDINGVLIDNIIDFIELYNEKYNTQYQKSDVTSWEFFRDWNISEKEFFEIFYAAYENKSSETFVDDNAQDCMKFLNQNHAVYILSAFDFNFRTQLIKKLEFHGIKKDIHYIKLIVVKERPYDLKIQHEFDVYVDDNPNLVNAIKKLKNRFLLLYDQPWNQNEICEDNVIRVYNWKNVVETISELKSHYSKID